MKHAPMLAMLTLPLAVAAHDGHGLSGAHWHATDTWGFIACAIALAAALWFARRK